MQRKERYRVLSLMGDWVVRRERDGQIMSRHATEDEAEVTASGLAKSGNGMVVRQGQIPERLHGDGYSDQP
jgi:hypothetical protein